MTNGAGRANVKLLDGGLIRLMFGHGAQALGYSSMPMLPVLLVYYGASREEVGWVMAAGSAGGLLFRPVVGWALDAWGKVRTLMVGTTVLACAMMSMGLISSLAGSSILRGSARALPRCPVHSGSQTPGSLRANSNT